MAGVTDREGPAPAPPASIRVETVVAPDGTALLSIAGESDVATEGVVRAALDEALARQPVRVVVDLAGLEFIDSSGLLLLWSPPPRVPRRSRFATPPASCGASSSSRAWRRCST